MVMAADSNPTGMLIFELFLLSNELNSIKFLIFVTKISSSDIHNN